MCIVSFVSLVKILLSGWSFPVVGVGRSALVSGFTGQTRGSKVGRDKAHSIVSTNRSATPQILHRGESGPHGLSAWQTWGTKLLGPNNGTEFKRCISSPLPWFIVHSDCHWLLRSVDCLLRRVMNGQSWLHLRSLLALFRLLYNKVLALVGPLRTVVVDQESGSKRGGKWQEGGNSWASCEFSRWWRAAMWSRRSQGPGSWKVSWQGGWQMQPADAQELHRKLLSCCSQVGQRGSPASLGKSQKINSNGKELKEKTEQTNATKGRLWNHHSLPLCTLSFSSPFVEAVLTISQIGFRQIQQGPSKAYCIELSLLHINRTSAQCWTLPAG